MRRILYVVIGLLALFTILRANAQDGGEGSARYLVQPGVLEFQGNEGGSCTRTG